MDKEIDNVISILDNLCSKDVSRIKICTSENQTEGVYTKEYHHGRCDVNSVFASPNFKNLSCDLDVKNMGDVDD